MAIEVSRCDRLGLSIHLRYHTIAGTLDADFRQKGAHFLGYLFLRNHMDTNREPHDFEAIGRKGGRTRRRTPEIFTRLLFFVMNVEGLQSLYFRCHQCSKLTIIHNLPLI